MRPRKSFDFVQNEWGWAYHFINLRKEFVGDGIYFDH
jgi:hypothetical protein